MCKSTKLWLKLGPAAIQPYSHCHLREKCGLKKRKSNVQARNAKFRTLIHNLQRCNSWASLAGAGTGSQVGVEDSCPPYSDQVNVTYEIGYGNSKQTLSHDASTS